jgi:hypothetical protein
MPYTLPTLRDRVEQQLADVTNTRYTQDAIDEAIRQALDAYSEHLPRAAIETINVTADGRELDISTLTYTAIQHVWWDYNSGSPDYPPHWRSFDVWPGNILFINDPEQPSAGDVVRIWYTTSHTLNQLDSATATTFPDTHASLLAQGAAALAVLARRAMVGEAVNDNPWAPRNLQIWAEQRLLDFNTRLDELAQQAAAQASGIAPGPILDRWDGEGVW